MPYSPEHDEVPNPLRAGLRGETMPEPCAIVVFGASGDLAHRKLIPALYNLALGAHLPAAFALVGVAKSNFTDDTFRGEMREAVGKFSRTKPVDDEVWGDFAAGMRWVNADAPDAYQKLKATLDEVDKTRATRGNRLFYFAVPPSAFPFILNKLKDNGLISSITDDRFTRVVIEKPFGYDLQSARKLNRIVHDVMHEKQVFRIDHYLGKETVQNLLVFRFGNSIFEPIWNNRYIDHVEITACEELGIEGRAKYYEEAGILRDMIQNHVLQLVTLTAMEPPVAFDADAVRDEKIKVLRAVTPIEGAEVWKRVVLGQYTAGSLGGEDVKGYQQEEDVKPGSKTPTYAALKLSINSWRWDGVPFYLRASKRLAKRRTEIAVHFSSLPHSLFGSGASQPNVLVIRVQPEEGITLRFAAKVPGERYRPRMVSMDFRYGTAFGSNSSPEAYERLLLDAMRGDQTLFTRTDEVEAAWKIVGGILDQTDAKDAPAPFPYEAGSWGPPEADQLLASDGRRWRKL